MYTYYWRFILSLILILICCFTYLIFSGVYVGARSVEPVYFICFWTCVYIIILISICICLKHFYLTVERNNWLSNMLALSVPDKGYSRNVSCALNLISTFYYNRWADTSAGRLLVPAEGIMRQVVSVSALTWFISYIFYWNLQFLNHVIIIKTKVLLQT